MVLKSDGMFSFHPENVVGVYPLGNLITEYSFCRLIIISHITIVTPTLTPLH
jgi:hypothetical protein